MQSTSGLRKLVKRPPFLLKVLGLLHGLVSAIYQVCLSVVAEPALPAQY